MTEIKKLSVTTFALLTIRKLSINRYSYMENLLSALNEVYTTDIQSKFHEIAEKVDV